jgi:hypothetical protein
MLVDASEVVENASGVVVLVDEELGVETMTEVAKLLDADEEELEGVGIGGMGSAQYCPGAHVDEYSDPDVLVLEGVGTEV